MTMSSIRECRVGPAGEKAYASLSQSRSDLRPGICRATESTQRDWISPGSVSAPD